MIKYQIPIRPDGDFATQGIYHTFSPGMNSVFNKNDKLLSGTIYWTLEDNVAYKGLGAILAPLRFRMSLLTNSL